MLKEINEHDVLITHSTKFHADDVFSTALMLMLNPKAKLIRTLDVEESIKICKGNLEEYIIYDIGMGEFDHHQKDARVRDNGIKYAAFGLLWERFGDWDQYPDFDRDFVQKIDDHDNGGTAFDISKMIDTFNPTQEERDDEFYDDEDRYFDEAVEIAKSYLYRIFQKYDDENNANEYLRKNSIYDEFYGVLFIPEFCNYKKYVYKNFLSCKAVVYPSLRGGYNAQVVTITPDTMQSNYTFPTDLCGLSKDDLPDGITFVHNSGFLLAAETADIAMSYAKNVSLKKK